jgi:hypothetical protein
MRGVMPSQVVAVIDEWFSHAQSPPSQNVSLNTSQFNQLQAIVRLINEIPTELIVVPVEKYSDLALALATIEVNFSHWIHKGGNFGLPRVKGRDAISVIRDVLTLCSDEYPPPATADLLFIVDVELRENIRRDIGAIERALANAEWKAANVLAGSAIEALLHWRLNQSPPTSAEIAAATGALVTSGRMQKPKTSDRDDWSWAHRARNRDRSKACSELQEFNSSGAVRPIGAEVRSWNRTFRRRCACACCARSLTIADSTRSPPGG